MTTQQPQLVFTIRGLDCADEVAVLKREVGPVVGGADRLSFDVLNARMAVGPGPEAVTEEAVVRAVARTGMRAEPWRGDEVAKDEGRFWDRRGRTVLTAASALFTLLGFLAHAWLSGSVRAALGEEGTGVAQGVPTAAKVLYGVGILAGVWHFLPKAWLALRRLRPDMNLLMTVAIAGAIGIGEWFEAATVALLFAVSLALESWSVGRARNAVAALMDLAPSTVTVLKAGGEERVLAAAVTVGTRFLVRPGDRIALDGRVARGESDVNQAPITGESAPVPKGPGQEIFAGTINGDGVLEAESTRPASDTTLARIIRLVGEAQSRRAPSEQWVEKFARVYTPSVMALAAAVLLVPPLLFGAAWGEWLYRALVLLVIACPCALVISTPVTIVAALAASARHGVLIKGGIHVETPSRLRAVALDKTGTLTRGRPAVVEVVPLDGHTEADLLGLAAALEARSTHPLAQAILDAARERGIAVVAADDVRAVPGKGVTGHRYGREHWLGSHRYLEERKQGTEDILGRLKRMSGAGRTVVVVGDATHVCGLIGLADAVRPNAREAVQALRDAGVGHVVMLTGDNRETAQAVAAETGVDEVLSELLPEDKVRAVEALVAKYGAVAMVGDGVNDAPALGRATLGVAMGAVGSDAAIETADVALMSDDLSKLPWLVRHSRRALGVIRQNIVFSLAVKAVFVVLTFAGHASLWAAIAADMGASLLVIFNALRLLRPQQTTT